MEEAGGSASLFGISSGAVLALKAASQGVAVTRLALYEPPFIVDDTRRPVPDTYVRHLRELAETGRRGDAVAYFMTAGVGMPEEAVAEMRQAPFWGALEPVAHTIAYDATFMAPIMRGDREPLQRWASVQVPALVMDGSASPPWLHNAARALADVLPGSTYRTLEGQTHDVAPAALVPVLTEFFAA